MACGVPPPLHACWLPQALGNARAMRSPRLPHPPLIQGPGGPHHALKAGEDPEVGCGGPGAVAQGPEGGGEFRVLGDHWGPWPGGPGVLPVRWVTKSSLWAVVTAGDPRDR